MISFVTSHDVATRANAKLWNYLSIHPSVLLLGPDAVADRLHQSLKDSPGAPLVIFSHGRRRPTHCVVGNDSKPALNEESLTLVGARSVFAMACWTGLVLGNAAGRKGAVWWGFDNSVSPPPSAWLDHYRSLFTAILTTFGRLQAKIEIEIFLNEVVLKAEKLERKLVKHDIKNPEYFFILRSLKADLKVWLPFTDEPIYHPGGVRRPLEPGD